MLDRIKMDKFVCILVAVVGVQLCCCRPPAVSKVHVSRIIGGFPATGSQFPYVISLQKKSLVSEPTRGHECGGALITRRHAVTSGFCLYTDNGLKEAAEYRVFTGATHLTDDDSADLSRDVHEFTPHPEYSGLHSNVNDIGIITFVNEFPVNVVSIAPIAISQDEPEERTWCEVAGWGARSIQDQQASVELHHVSRYIVNQVGCTALADWAGGPVIQSHMLCGGMTEIFTPSCTHDSGNALVCNGALAGVLSWHDPDCFIYNSVEIYTSTALFYEWMDEIVNKVEEEEEEQEEEAEEEEEEENEDEDEDEDKDEDEEEEEEEEEGEEEEEEEDEEEEEEEEQEEEEGEPGAAPTVLAITLALLPITTLTHLFYCNSM